MSSILLKSEIKIEQVCRTCLSKEIELCSVFDACLGTETLGSVIATITGIKFETGDGMPTTVCRDCKEKATSAFDFKCRSLEADEALRGLLTVKSEDNVTDSRLFDPRIVEVKTEEEFPADTHDDFLDLDFNLPESNDGEALTDLGDCGEGSSTYCPVCGESYEDAAGLTRHMWRSHADLMGPKKRGRPKQLLTSAILRKLSENGYQAAIRRHSCVLCRAEASSREDLALHMLQHKDEKVLSCLQCKKMYLKKKDFDRHHCGNRTDTEQQQENEPPEGQADRKPRESYATEVLLQELLMPNNDAECDGVVHVCGTCGGVFPSSAELADHRDTDHPDQSLRCGHCHKVFASLRGAARHRGSCALVERSFGCVSCGAKFQHEITLNKHILRHHAGHPVSIRFNTTAPPESRDSVADTHRCDTCNRTFCRKDLLVKHVKLHKPGDKCFECDICNKKFHRRNNLRSHMRTHEARPTSGGSSACLCLYCGRGFSNSSNLIVHMRRHTGEKPYKCDFCGKGFPRSSDLQCHRRSHTGEKPCVCGVCGKGFSRSNKLSRHMRVHTGLKPYKCPYCEKAFSQSNDLTLHVRRHTGDKPYVCELCGDRFIQGTALHNHRRAHGHFPAAHIISGGHAQAVATVNGNPESLPYATLTLAN